MELTTRLVRSRWIRTSIVKHNQVAISVGEARYPECPPFSPHKSYPEYPFSKTALAAEPNHAYEAVRESLRLLSLDRENFGKESWNPLADVVRADDTVVIKPNFVREFRESYPGHANCLITHGSIIRAMVDYVYVALSGTGRIVIADAPHSDADFDAISSIAGLAELQAFYQTQAGFCVEVYDLRPERARKVDGVIVGHDSLPGDPRGYVKIDVGARSEFMEVKHLCHLLYGSEYDTGELYRHHHSDVHEYLVSRTVLDADVVICIPKLKTHKKVGLTVNLKNLVGINGNKNWLPHHRDGTPAQGGDQFADNSSKRRLERIAVSQFRRWFPLLGPLRRSVAGPIKLLGKRVFGDTNTDTIRSGNWYGNDTTWRMVLDLNRILRYADSSGKLHDDPVREFFSVVDGIVGGEGNGPLDSTPKPVGVVLAGFNPVAVDLAAARLMGFDYDRIPVLRRALEPHPLKLMHGQMGDLMGCSNDRRFDRPVGEFAAGFAFRPHFGWEGHIEIGSGSASTSLTR